MKEEKYSSVHVWLSRTYGPANHCEKCGSSESGRYDWAHIHGTPMSQNRNNFMPLCRKCHIEYDDMPEKISNTLKGNIPWNKGKKTGPSGRLGQSFSEEWKNNIRKSRQGITLSEDHKNNIRMGLLGKKRGPYKNKV